MATVNGALATAALTLLAALHATLLCVAFAALAKFVSVVGYDLLRHTSDQRMRGARKAAWLIQMHLKHEYGIDPWSVAQQSDQEPTQDYDRDVLGPYNRAILLSAVPALFVAAWAIYQAYPEC